MKLNFCITFLADSVLELYLPLLLNISARLFVANFSTYYLLTSIDSYVVSVSELKGSHCLVLYCLLDLSSDSKETWIRLKAPVVSSESLSTHCAILDKLSVYSPIEALPLLRDGTHGLRRRRPNVLGSYVYLSLPIA